MHSGEAVAVAALRGAAGEGVAVARDGAVELGAREELAAADATPRRLADTTHLRVVNGGRSLPRAIRVRRRAGEIVRRLVEGTAAALLLLALVPLLIAISLAIRIDSGGPALFRQRRLGRGRREFTVFKFRTMRAGADTAPHREYVKSLIHGDRGPKHGRLYKLSVDDRVTSVGRFLRSWSLDELPQLINVLRGDMAFVGPRPVIPYEAENYPPHYLPRFDVRPGLTGLWQVSGRNERSYHEMVTLDIQYAAHASAWRDLQILLRTVPVVLRRQGVA